MINGPKAKQVRKVFPLEDQIIVATGAFHILSRAGLRETVAEAGGHLMGRITEATTILIVGGPGGISQRKVTAAKREGVRIVSELEFVTMLGEQ